MRAKRNIRSKSVRLAAALCGLILAAGAAAQDNADGYWPVDLYSGTVKQHGSKWLFTPCTQDEKDAWTAEWLREEDRKLAETLTAAHPPPSQRHSQPNFWLKVLASVNSRQNSVRIHEVAFSRENESCRPIDYLDALFQQ